VVVAVREQVQVLFLQGICMYVAIGEEKLTIWEYLLYMVYMIPLSLSSPLLSFFHSFEYMLGDILNPDWG
tara:strand:+ start:218 stop:427 length:210 start_codon:yes stop_codon:yes gene_type:complete